jgi:hypothetical protein
VLARTYRRDDCASFLDQCIAKKAAEISDLDGVDPFGAALITAEITRLRTIRGLIDGTIPLAYAEEDADGQDPSTVLVAVATAP